MEGVELVGKLQARGNEVSKYDNMFGMKLRFFEGSATFVQKVKFTAAQYVIDAYLEYGACNARVVCLLQRSTSSTQARRLP